MRNIIEVGRAGVEPSIPSPLMYDWHGSRYYGAAHGLAGILVTLLQVSTCVNIPLVVRSTVANCVSIPMHVFMLVPVHVVKPL